MLQSRALPEDFDMSQALQSTYGGQHVIGTPMASPVGYVPYNGYQLITGRVLDTRQSASRVDAAVNLIIVVIFHQAGVQASSPRGPAA